MTGGEGGAGQDAEPPGSASRSGRNRHQPQVVGEGKPAPRSYTDPADLCDRRDRAVAQPPDEMRQSGGAYRSGRLLSRSALSSRR